MKSERHEYESKRQELQQEIQNHEEVMEIMARRFDEQHAKVMVSDKAHHKIFGYFLLYLIVLFFQTKKKVIFNIIRTK